MRHLRQADIASELEFSVVSVIQPRWCIAEVSRGPFSSVVLTLVLCDLSQPEALSKVTKRVFSLVVLEGQQCHDTHAQFALFTTA